MRRNLLHNIWHSPRNLIALLITGYQKSLSPDHGPLRTLFPYGYCRHEPTCSQYGREIVLKRGVVIGIPLLLRRILTCHPWKRLSDEKIMAISRKR